MNGLSGSMLLVLLSALLVLFSASHSFSEQIVTGQETTDNYLPEMGEFDKSGGTSVGTGSGCPSGSFCTAGTNQQGGTYSTTFDLEDQMSIDEINRGFALDYSVDVRSHPSNSVLSSCTSGVLQSGDCRDIFRVTVSLFSFGNVLEHKFEDEIELDFSGTRNFAFQQNVPENSFSQLEGGFELFGIDAGFPSGFFGPHFSNPALSTTFDLVSFIETEIIDIITDAGIISDNPISVVEIDLTPPPPEPEMEVAEIEIEAEFAQELQIMSSPPEVAPPPVEFSQPATEEAPVSEQMEAEVESEIQQELSPQEPETSEQEPETSEQETAEAEPETEEAPSETAEAEPSETEQDAEEQETEEQPKPKVVVKKAVKEKIAKRIIKRMGSSGRYDTDNQLKTLVVMQVLGNSKSFFKATTSLEDRQGFFNNERVPDSTISNNNFAQYVLFGGSSNRHNSLVNLQWE
jgi:hypothetical protein